MGFTTYAIRTGWWDVTRAARYTKHRDVAFSEVNAFLRAGKYVRGYTIEDLEQEAMVAVWVATSTYDPAKGSFARYAAVAVRFALADLIRRSTNGRRRALDMADRPEQLELPGIDQTWDTVERRDSMRAILDAFECLTDLERRAVTMRVLGAPLRHRGRGTTQLSDAAVRAERKLRARLQPPVGVAA